MTTFRNEPLLDLRLDRERSRLGEALTAIDATLPITVPVVVAGDARPPAGEELLSVDPGAPGTIVGRAAATTTVELDAAVAVATEAGAQWGARRADERAAILSRAAGHLRGRRYELAALIVREAGKPWAEADADVCEAIDFLEFYARGAVELEHTDRLEQLPGERNSLHYRPRGVVAVIAPWNFPLAIATGMTAAALATGNAVCLKPAEQSPACALALVDALADAGLPTGVLALVPGEGATGAALVEHPGIHTIAFTGSGAVGLEILRKAAVLAPGQRHLKRVVAEMGGKNCVIVDADADLDDVVPAVIKSAFVFAGQKCSAASRLLVHDRIYSELLERLIGALDTLLVDRAQVFGVDVPPVIEASARDRVEQAVTAALAYGASVHRGDPGPDDDGFFVAPTIVAGAPAESAVISQELFGPVLSVEAVAGLDEACDIVDTLAFALTGGLFTRNPRVIEGVSARTRVGNLYINRHTTGAMVARQPFGGNRLSGTGTKAGGHDYLLSFVEPVVISENTVRHGLAV